MIVTPLHPVLEEILSRVRTAASEQQSDADCSLDPQSETDKVGTMVRERLLAGGVAPRYVDARKEAIKPNRWKAVSGFFTGQSYFIWGPTGVGKTFLASALVHEKVTQLVSAAIENKARIVQYPRMVVFVDLLIEIRDCFRESSETSEKTLINRYVDCDCLVLDDIGAEKVTEWTVQTLFAIVDKRYRHERQTLFTSNLSLSDLHAKVGERIASRIAGACGRHNVIELRGGDMRLECPRHDSNMRPAD